MPCKIFFGLLLNRFHKKRYLKKSIVKNYSAQVSPPLSPLWGLLKVYFWGLLLTRVSLAAGWAPSPPSTGQVSSVTLTTNFQPEPDFFNPVPVAVIAGAVR